MSSGRPGYPDIDDDLFWRLHDRWRPHSLLSVERLYSLYTVMGFLAGSGLHGAVVECGVWRGGAAALCAATLAWLGDTERAFYLFETFDGFPEDVREPVFDGSVLTHDNWHRDDVQAVVETNLRATGYPTDRIHLIRGRVEDSLPCRAPETIAHLHLDTDCYGSTLHELRTLYPRVVTGGLVSIDDYGHFSDCARAVTEYFAGTAVFLHRIDYTGRLIIKSGQ
ncbi:MAG: TylF/MycF/NovP-related O-methyltransferase [Rhodospirillaceae bacterium]